jgi:hypothetical protein
MPGTPTAAGDIYRSADGLSALRGTLLHSAVQIDYVGGTNPIYVGFALPGTATSIPGWKIAKLTFDLNNNPTQVQWANGDNGYVNVWDNRVTFPYA